MPVFNLFSDRNRVADGKTSNVLVYNDFPKELRAQIIHIWRDAIGPFHPYGPYDVGWKIENNEGWAYIHNTFIRERGLFKLTNNPRIDWSCELYLLESNTVEDVLDLVEVSFFYIDSVVRKFQIHDRKSRGITVTADSAIGELNERLSRAGVGYQFHNGKIIRLESELIHSEVVRPTLRFLHEPGFEGPCDEFLRAHAHYRSGEMKNAIIDANNAFESTLKVICDKRRWQYPTGARASDLLRIVRNQGLLPTYLDNSFDQLSATLKSGLPKVRNAEGAHGHGTDPRETPVYVAAYALHLAAANILFLVNAHNSLR